MDGPWVLFFCGPHCSGKSTLLKTFHREGLLSQRGSEIGKDLYYSRHLETAGQDEAFEFEVSELELARDRIYLETKGVVGIESWHPGNLAYAAVRNRTCLPRLTEYMRTSPLLERAYGLRFHVSERSIAVRTQTFANTAEWAATFYTQIERELDSCLELLGLQDHVIHIDADRPFDDVERDARRALERYLSMML